MITDKVYILTMLQLICDKLEIPRLKIEERAKEMELLKRIEEMKI